MTKKRIFSCIMAVIMVFFATGGYYANAEGFTLGTTFDGYKEDRLALYFRLAEESVKTYYLSTMYFTTQEQKLFVYEKKLVDSNNVNFALLDGISLNEQTKDYLETKQRYETINMMELDYKKTYVVGKYNTIKWEIVEEHLICYVYADIIFQYSDFDQPSGIGRTVQVVFENPKNPTIVDWYVFDDSFDEQVRGYDLDLSNSENWLNKQNENEILIKKANCLENIEKFVADAKSLKAKLESENQEVFSSQSLISIQATQTCYEKMVSYANSNYYKTNPSSGNSVTPFNDAVSPGCTNFISHCMLYGGFKQRLGQNGQENCWYFTSMSDRSSSWGGVTPLYNFLTAGYSTGPTSSNITANSNYPFRAYPLVSSYWPAPGCIVQIKYNYSGGYAFPNYGHCTLLTGFSGYAGSLDEYLVTYRTSSSSSSNGSNLKITEYKYPAPNTTSGSGGHLYRVIKLDSSRAS